MRIGILGGSFDPIHIGHAILANYGTQFGDIDTLWLMVSPQNPLKNEISSEYDGHRLRMAQLVAEKCDNVSVSGLEFTLPKPSYTVNTLKILSEKFSIDEFVLIIGADNWANFSKWKDYEQILNNYDILVFPRKGYEIIIPEKYSKRVKKLNAPLIEISSTFIRQQLKDMRNMNFFLPQDVYRYILEHKLYM